MPQRKRHHKRKHKHGTRARQKQSGVTGTFDSVIDHIGHRGDGVMFIEGTPVYVPYTVPSDHVRAEVKNSRGRIKELLDEGPGRVKASCVYYGTCGGCNLQHLAKAPYDEWKVAQVTHALAQRGLDHVAIQPLIVTAPGTRRRVTLTAIRKGGHIVLGYHARASHEIVPIETCPLLEPKLNQALPMLQRIAEILLDETEPLTFLATTTQDGVDLALTTPRRRGSDLSYDQRQDLADLLAQGPVDRITFDGELLLQERLPVIDVAGVPITPPAGAFLQASEDSQRALQKLVSDGVEDAKHVADLFCGSGTFALALANERSIHAVDYDQAMLEGLRKAAAHAQGLKSITIEARNLFEGPLSGKELSGFDAVVFDPPRAGAKAQAEALVDSDVPRIVGVSCDPGTFARDAHILYEGGYELLHITPVDQFLWSHHIEVVGVFVRS